MVSLASTESKWVVDRYEDNSLEGDTVELLLQAGPQHLVAGLDKMNIIPDLGNHLKMERWRG